MLIPDHIAIGILIGILISLYLFPIFDIVLYWLEIKKSYWNLELAKHTKSNNNEYTNAIGFEIPTNEDYIYEEDADGKKTN